MNRNVKIKGFNLGKGNVNSNACNKHTRSKKKSRLGEGMKMIMGIKKSNCSLAPDIVQSVSRLLDFPRESEKSEMFAFKMLIILLFFKKLILCGPNKLSPQASCRLEEQLRMCGTEEKAFSVQFYSVLSAMAADGTQCAPFHNSRKQEQRKTKLFMCFFLFVCPLKY